MVKHESEYDVVDASEYNPELRGHLEAQIANVADELAYTAHDLDDGLASENDHTSILEGVALWEILRKYGIKNSIRWAFARRRVIRRLIGLEVNGSGLQPTSACEKQYPFSGRIAELAISGSWVQRRSSP